MDLGTRLPSRLIGLRHVSIERVRRCKGEGYTVQYGRTFVAMVTKRIHGSGAHDSTVRPELLLCEKKSG